MHSFFCVKLNLNSNRYNKMTTIHIKYVKLEDIVGELAREYGWPLIPLDGLILLGQRAVKVYGIEERSKKITFSELCDYISDYISTPFGRHSLEDILTSPNLQ